MPDNVAQQSHRSNASKHMLSNMKDRESKKPCQSSWISHLIPSSNNLVLPVNKSSAVSDESSAENGVKQRREPVKIPEARKLSGLDLDVSSDSNTKYRNTCRYRKGLVDVTSNPLQSAEGVLTKTSRIKITDEGPGLLKWNLESTDSTLEAKATSLGTLSKPFPLLNFKSFVDPKTDSAVCNGHSSWSQMNSKYGIDVASVGMKESPVPLAVHMPKTSGISSQVEELPDQWMKHYRSLEKKAVSSSRPFQDDLEGSISCSLMHGMPDGSKYRKSMVESCACIQEEKWKSSSRGVSEQCFASTSTFIASGKQIGKGKSIEKYKSPSYLVQKKSSLQHHDLLQRKPTCFFNDVETFGLNRAVDSVEGGPEGPSKVSKTTHHLFFTKKTNMNLSKGNQVMIGSSVSENFDGDAFHGLVGMPPVLCCYCRQQSISQTLEKSSRTGVLCEEFHNVHCKSWDGMGEGSSSSRSFYPRYCQCADNDIYNNAHDSKGHSKRFPLPFFSRKQVESKQEDDVGCHAVMSGEDESTFKTGENESPAKTAHKEVVLCPSRNFTKGVTLSSVQKDALVSQDPAKSQATAISLSPSKEARSRNTEAHIPDKNEELPIGSGVLGSADDIDKELSTSRTESLDAEHLLLHVDRPGSSNSSFQQDCPLTIDSITRWIKRLRSNSLEAHGTKSLNMGDISSREKGKSVSRILGNRGAGSEPTISSLGKGHQKLEKTKDALRHHREASSVDSQKEYRDVALSHSWIQRWRRIKGASPWTGPSRVIYEPHHSKVALEDFHGKQFPSIAAMALMGKAMTNFRPCEFKKSGSLVVWNSE